LNHLMHLHFEYSFEDGDIIPVEFQMDRFRHILGIHHIDRTTSDENIFQKIDEGLSFGSWRANPRQRRKFNDMKDRIALFSCVYSTMRFGRIFFCPGQRVKNSPRVKLDYIIFRIIDNHGMNLGIRERRGIATPLTILPSRRSSDGFKRYIDDNNIKIVKKLKIINKNTNEIIDSIMYTDNFIMSSGQ
ncbi:MAG: hypothetical protein IJ672_01720, partial [Methanobrevibacter sp.]|nr:hypothetical protein [Methanobrevibacter sp.]